MIGVPDACLRAKPAATPAAAQVARHAAHALLSCKAAAHRSHCANGKELKRHTLQEQLSGTAETHTPHAEQAQCCNVPHLCAVAICRHTVHVACCLTMCEPAGAGACGAAAQRDSEL